MIVEVKSFINIFNFKNLNVKERDRIKILSNLKSKIKNLIGVIKDSLARIRTKLGYLTITGILPVNLSWKLVDARNSDTKLYKSH